MVLISALAGLVIPAVARLVERVTLEEGATQVGGAIGLAMSDARRTGRVVVVLGVATGDRSSPSALGLGQPRQELIACDVETAEAWVRQSQDGGSSSSEGFGSGSGVGTGRGASGSTVVLTLPKGVWVESATERDELGTEADSPRRAVGQGQEGPGGSSARASGQPGGASAGGALPESMPRVLLIAAATPEGEVWTPREGRRLVTTRESGTLVISRFTGQVRADRDGARLDLDEDSGEDESESPGDADGRDGTGGSNATDTTDENTELDERGPSSGGGDPETTR
ncbi:MAG: hypothetical protein SFZ23_13125 [Planctomycetota bacterium]|nr:hypothetical protein [Planctomycetota bacterium]